MDFENHVTRVQTAGYMHTDQEHNTEIRKKKLTLLTGV